MTSDRSKDVSAGHSEVRDEDKPLLDGITAREDELGAEPGNLNADDLSKPVGAQPASARTGRHESGMGANETIDGLSGNEENTRRAGEDEAAHTAEEDIPVFDRADLPPRV
jgi:hypothetical protein